MVGRSGTERVSLGSGESRRARGRSRRAPPGKKIGFPFAKSRIDARRERRSRTSRGTPTPTRRARDASRRDPCDRRGVDDRAQASSSPPAGRSGGIVDVFVRQTLNTRRRPSRSETRADVGRRGVRDDPRACTWGRATGGSVHAPSWLS